MKWLVVTVQCHNYMNVHVDVCSAGLGINTNVKLSFSHYVNVVPIVLLSKNID